MASAKTRDPAVDETMRKPVAGTISDQIWWQRQQRLATAAGQGHAASPI
jgi:hypothetical protein